MINSLEQCDTRLKQINEYLSDFAQLWQNEILSFYPNSYENQNLHLWVEEISKLSLDKVADMMNFQKINSLSPSLQIHYQTINHLASISPPPIAPKDNCLKHKIIKLTAKKKHEINSLISHITLKENDQVVDLAGGVGLLSQALSQHFHCNALVLEKNEKLIQTGREKKNLRTTFSAQDIFQLQKLPQAQLYVGLHCCGNLTTHILDLFQKTASGQLISLPCCYFKDPEKYTLGIAEISYEAKMLASRGSKSFTKAGLEKWFQVKRHRYAFELYARENELTLPPLKSAPPKLYAGSFSDYSAFYFKKLKIKTATHMDEFQNSQIKKIDEMIHLGFFRESLSRPLELAINLNRATKMAFKHFQIFEIFDETISPRNFTWFIKK